MVEYRPIQDDREVFHEYRSYAFRPEEGPQAYDPDEHDTPRALLGARRGIFTDDANDRPRCVCRHYWLEARVRGEDHPTGGMASVATPPEYRRQGHVGRLLEGSLAEYRERGVRFAVLWPFNYAFYRQFGWKTANRLASYECAPEVFAFAREHVDHDASQFRRLAADEHTELEEVYERHRDRYAMAFRRDERWWRRRVFGGHDVDPFVYAYERDDEVQGYLVYSFDDETDDETRRGRTMTVSELAYADREASLALLSFVADHESQAERVHLEVPDAFPLLETVPAPDRVETSIEIGAMVRVVDVVETLSALSYPNVDGSITIAVDDPLAAWNQGSFELTVDDGIGTCERLGDETDADVTLEVGSLSQLIVGYRSARDLERTDDLAVADDCTLETLEGLFPETDVYLGEHF
ncbi:GNAT family N-acetyltransferase [Natrarchaeobaculum sulfurireducens]|uniref:Acetyltransferase n=1 Tax=Natrarchaeobaculum sulfurireducens TaxID=2044521 RepID=A0A346PF61_9EURY|nr:GNAT family N-acetyltransferase [Natrarchaeobaculum sulfurireducens]AXR78156.1 Acetyltransferase [Natrarchaeobaculum sulfurireducens]